MGLLDRLRALLSGDAASGLLDYPEQFRTERVASLHVHTANLSPDTDELLVIVTLPHTARELFSLLDAPLRLTAPDARAVTFVPVERAVDPALDPNLGWIIGVTGETIAELTDLPAGPGEHELSSLHLGIVLE
ncbi:hypothetical protein [Corynebacterium sp.]|uniref:hypothetical protein n=1 Tax=Corynebacterium sp. TaxID=1720 RepID=UPI002A91943A|nr:hypothetical protein [Corynebacterium sp.]MDY5785526.1 hypothetical protein [Corynebacterium sp.]